MNPSGRFQIEHSGVIRDRMRFLMRVAVEEGCGPRVLVALGIIEHRLQLDPRAWGDPIRRLAAAELMVYKVVHDELAVEYAVHDHRQLVWIIKIVPVLSHPLRARDEQAG